MTKQSSNPLQKTYALRGLKNTIIFLGHFGGEGFRFFRTCVSGRPTWVALTTHHFGRQVQLLWPL